MTTTSLTPTTLNILLTKCNSHSSRLSNRYILLHSSPRPPSIGSYHKTADQISTPSLTRHDTVTGSTPGFLHPFATGYDRYGFLAGERITGLG
ncbi:hypothetical protein PoB_000145400 [Plakobranchus ocellatus]|uniref:Uncharacterized protein n=1 Tax=Plakobranchus ocellatus TaxID=259542 RepID=A0AAV3XYY2_9GAST|nr:hypothetical protein PoB_000145400 [Plakobranchus ocellatus]